VPESVEDSDRQLPVGQEVFLDHVGHFVRSVDEAREALIQAGFHTAPVSIQTNRAADGTSQLSGTGNVTVMLESGYIEVLFKTADTPLGQEFDEALSRYAGLHLAAFAVADADAKSQALSEAGVRVRPIVNLRRPVETETGVAEAAFTVARVERGEMAEGRMQYLTHHSEDVVWQTRWLNHANGSQALLDVVIAVEDVAEAAERFGRFLDRAPVSATMGEKLPLERGGVLLMERAAFEAEFGPVPQLPFIGLYGLRVASLAICEEVLARNDLSLERRENALLARFPEALGQGAWLFVESDEDLPWRAS
jgi:hypothetical protein